MLRLKRCIQLLVRSVWFSVYCVHRLNVSPACFRNSWHICYITVTAALDIFTARLAFSWRRQAKAVCAYLVCLTAQVFWSWQPSEKPPVGLATVGDVRDPESRVDVVQDRSGERNKCRKGGQVSVYSKLRGPLWRAPLRYFGRRDTWPPKCQYFSCP